VWLNDETKNYCVYNPILTQNLHALRPRSLVMCGDVERAASGSLTVQPLLSYILHLVWRSMVIGASFARWIETGHDGALCFPLLRSMRHLLGVKAQRGVFRSAPSAQRQRVKGQLAGTSAEMIQHELLV